MIKILELIGFALVGGMIYAFLGLMAQGDPMGQYIFWSCAVGTVYGYGNNYYYNLGSTVNTNYNGWSRLRP